MNKSLEERFLAFAKGLDGAEFIDELTLTREQEIAQKADFFFKNRSIICELKSLKTDTEDKIETILRPYENTPEWPHFYGEQDIQKILNFLPDKDQINAKLFKAVTDSVERLIEKANRQIRTTKETFNLPSSGGLLIILNDVVDILSPDLLSRRVTRSLQKKTDKKEVRFPEITVVWIVNAAHYAQLTSTLKAMPLLTMPSGQPDPNDIEGFVTSLGQKWSAYEGVPFIKGTYEALKKAGYKKFSDDAKQGLPKPRHEVWRLQYRRNPYLRSLSKEDLLKFGQRAMSRLGQIFLKGVKRKPSKELMQELTPPFTHFLEEMNFRAIDMKEFHPMVDSLDERLKLITKDRSKKSKAYKNKIGRGAPCPCQSGKTYSKCCGRNK